MFLTVPMGLPDPPDASAEPLLRKHFPAIGGEDPLVLWWGSVWRWLDAGTAIEAIGRLAATRPDVRFVITAGKPPNAATDPLNVTDEARDLARRTGLLDRNVFFLDDWVPFEERHRYLGDADVGLTLHAATEEASLAARARYMDYVWASLPSVLAEGDEVGDRLAQAGAARLVPPRDPEATAATLDKLLGDRDSLANARQACRDVAAEYRWDALVAPLVAGVESLDPRSGLDVADPGRGPRGRRLLRAPCRRPLHDGRRGIVEAETVRGRGARLRLAAASALLLAVAAVGIVALVATSSGSPEATTHDCSSPKSGCLYVDVASVGGPCNDRRSIAEVKSPEHAVVHARTRGARCTERKRDRSPARLPTRC